MKTMTYFALAVLTFGVTSFAATAQDKCDPKTTKGCPSVEESTKPDAKTSGTVTEVVLPNPQTDIEIYQSVCIDPDTNMLWGRTIRTMEGKGLVETDISEPAPTARCQPDHNPAMHAPNGSWLK